MVRQLINKEFYEAVIHFEDSEEAREFYYRIMDTKTGKVAKDGKSETVRDQILRIYAMLFCEELVASGSLRAGVEDVAATADLLHIGNMGYDPKHWYRMQHHFPIIDEDNFDRFAALVIADMNAGPLRDEAVKGGDVLLVGEADPLSMTREERKHQKVRKVSIAG